MAVKIIDAAQGKDYVMKNLTREAKMLSMLQHPNIMRLYETIRVSERGISRSAIPPENLEEGGGAIDRVSLF